MKSKYSLRPIKFMAINGLKFQSIFQGGPITKSKIISTAHSEK
jgi:hypothetical protein